MEKTNVKYNAYIKILEEELRPAMGCTEPIALAYAAAVARKVLGELPDKVVIGASGSIIKNVKSVIVPNTDHLKGIPAAAAAGGCGLLSHVASGQGAGGDRQRREGSDRGNEGVPGKNAHFRGACGQWLYI